MNKVDGSSSSEYISSLNEEYNELTRPVCLDNSSNSIENQDQINDVSLEAFPNPSVPPAVENTPTIEREVVFLTREEWDNQPITSNRLSDVEVRIVNMKSANKRI